MNMKILYFVEYVVNLLHFGIESYVVSNVDYTEFFIYVNDKLLWLLLIF
jgi:hypothetical protein